jgi:enterochelin esterase-like enzyme
VRPAPPARDPHTEGYVTAKDLPDGEIPSADADGNFILAPTHKRAPDMSTQPGVPQGTVINFTMKSTDSKIYPGITREPNTFGKVDPSDPVKLIVTTSHPAPYSRKVAVYVPKQYVPGTEAPFIVSADGDQAMFRALDNLIAAKKVPVMIAIAISSGGGDAQGSQRGLEYDTMSGLYAEFVESEVLPLVEKNANVKLTKDPEGRATTGGSSGGSCALIMAWYHPDLYHRVLAYSCTAVNQQWPYNAETPHGAWEFHEHLIPNNPPKPIRIWMEVGDKDLLNPNVMRDNMHDWVLANELLAKALAAKNYHYQFVFSRNAGHVDGPTKQQTLPEALEYVWKGYPIAPATPAAGK